MAMNEKLVVPARMSLVSASSAVGAENLLNERLGRTALLRAGSVTIYDAGRLIEADTVALLANDSTDPARRWSVQGFRTAADAANNTNEVSTTGSVSTWASAEAGKRLHRQGLGYLSGAAARYFRVGVSSDINAGRLVIGKAFTAADTMDIGYSFKVYDMGDTRVSATALENSTIRGKALEYNWVWSWMSEAEARGALLDVLAYAGTTRDVLAILNPDAADLHNVIAYGRIVEEVEGINVAGGVGADMVNAYQAKMRMRSRLILNL